MSVVNQLFNKAGLIGITEIAFGDFLNFCFCDGKAFHCVECVAVLLYCGVLSAECSARVGWVRWLMLCGCVVVLMCSGILCSLNFVLWILDFGSWVLSAVVFSQAHSPLICSQSNAEIFLTVLSNSIPIRKISLFSARYFR